MTTFEKQTYLHATYAGFELYSGIHKTMDDCHEHGETIEFADMNWVATYAYLEKGCDTDDELDYNIEPKPPAEWDTAGNTVVQVECGITYEAPDGISLKDVELHRQVARAFINNEELDILDTDPVFYELYEPGAVHV